MMIKTGPLRSDHLPGSSPVSFCHFEEAEREKLKQLKYSPNLWGDVAQNTPRRPCHHLCLLVDSRRSLSHRESARNDARHEPAWNTNQPSPSARSIDHLVLESRYEFSRGTHTIGAPNDGVGAMVLVNPRPFAGLDPRERRLCDRDRRYNLCH